MVSKSFYFFPVLFFLVGCQIPGTRLVEKNFGMESRLFSKIRSPLDLKKSIIVDVRSRFQFQISRLPRSFHAYWKDWSLADFRGKYLIDRKNHLQRLLALNGIDPLTRVVVLGGGLKGRGEEFLIASTLLRLGVKKLSFMTEKQVHSAVTTGDGIPVENVPYWSEELKVSFECQNQSDQPDIVIDFVDSTLKGKRNLVLRSSQIFSEDLKVKYKFRLEKKYFKIFSKNSFWSYGLVLYFREKGKKSCVLR